MLNSGNSETQFFGPDSRFVTGSQLALFFRRHFFVSPYAASTYAVFSWLRLVMALFRTARNSPPVQCADWAYWALNHPNNFTGARRGRVIDRSCAASRHKGTEAR